MRLVSTTVLATGGASAGIRCVLFRGSRRGWPRTVEDVAIEAIVLFSSLGGLRRVESVLQRHNCDIARLRGYAQLSSRDSRSPPRNALGHTSRVDADRSRPERDPRRYLDSLQVPYLAIPPELVERPRSVAPIPLALAPSHHCGQLVPAGGA
jgi:hypothetical protein